MTELALIGDIHGCMAELEEIVDRALTRTRRLIFLGDYVNRGHHSRDVVDYLIDLSLSSISECTFLRGNHDETFLDALSSGNLDPLFRMGGATTIASYIQEPTKDIVFQLRQCVPVDHVEFFRTLEPYVATNGIFAAHTPNTMQEAENSLGKYRVYGHIPQRYGRPTITKTQAFIDTGCGTTDDGRLTCLFWPSLDWIQSS